MSVEKKVPEIRFEGFSGEWCVKKLGQIYNFNYGEFNINPSNGGQYPVYGANGIIGGYTRFNAESSAVIGHMGEYAGSVLWAEGKHFVTYNGTIAKPIKSDFDALFGYFKLVKMNLNKICGGSGQPFLSYAALERLDFVLPSEKEQTAIGNTFQKLDSLISQHQQKHDKLSNIKKAMLEKMFPKQGETTPEIRFKGFSGEWEEVVLSEFAEKYDNLRVAVTAKDRIAGSTPYYGANGIQDYVEGFTHDGEYVLLAEDGANDLKNYPIHYVNGKVWVNNHAHVLKAKENGSNIFLKYALNNIDFEPFLVGGGRAKLNASIMMNLALTISTDIEEQTAIGNYFQKLDTLISQHQQQITKLNNIKQACLSKMFV
ncbi:restriction endonuclease subunit S [Shewanella glacialipiscicola]|uniref:restriction endonuclease subunit S n=1 Tax=Shewanella glacialipiscicola TaxID=614069 RepID=UPI003D7B5A04